MTAVAHAGKERQWRSTGFSEINSAAGREPIQDMGLASGTLYPTSVNVVAKD
jgi:hypothetical protein